MATQAQIDQIVQLYIGYFDRAPNPTGLNYWINELDNNPDMSYLDIAQSFSVQPEATGLYPFLANPQVASPEAFITAVYLNLFNRAPDADGLAYWEGELAAGKSPGRMIIDIQSGAQDSADGQDLTILNNKTAVALDWVQSTADISGFSYFNEDGSINAAAEASAKGVLDGVDATEESVAEGQAETAAYLDAYGETGAIALEVGVDNLTGTSGDDVFNAPIEQNMLGAVTNTFESGDTLDGGEGMDTLNVDMTLTTSGTIPVGPAISATTNSIEVVNLREQTLNIDTGFNGSKIDAEKMMGVEQWWSDNSRSNIQIEDIRSKPMDTAFGLNETDPGAGLNAYINANYLEGDVESESILTLTIQEINADVLVPGAELSNIAVGKVTFDLDGTEYALESADITAANTWADLEAALTAQIDGTAGLENLTVSHVGDGVFTISDSEGGALSADPATAVLLGFTGIDVRNRVEVGENLETLPTRTTVYLDDAGNGSQGGAVNVAGMSGERGIEVMDVVVDDDSHISALSSVNRGGLNGEQQLEVVNVTRGNADGTQNTGDLKIGVRTIDAGGEETTTDGRLAGGLQNVRVFNAEGFDGQTMIAAALNSNDVFDKYLDPDNGVVQFTYHMGDAGSNTSLFVQNEVAADDDFTLDLIGGDGEDRFNLRGLDVKDTTSVDGEGGVDTVEVNTSVDGSLDGAGNMRAWESFTNVENLVIAGSGEFTYDPAVFDFIEGNMMGLETVVIATDGDGGLGDDTTLINLDEGTDAVISGRNQTLNDNANNNADQDFRTIILDEIQDEVGVDTATVVLENTARTNGELTVNNLTVSNPEVGVDALEIQSNGRAQTSNQVTSFNAAALNTLTLVGTQDLTIAVDALADANGAGSGAGAAATIDGSDLAGDLVLATTGAVLNNAGADKVTGTAGANDTLQLSGVLAPGAVISGFETIQFGAPFNGSADAASGVFNAATASGVEEYVINLLSADLEMNNTAGDEEITVNTNLTDVEGNNLTFIAAAEDNSNALNLNFRDLDTSSVEGANNFGAAEIFVGNYNTINLDLDDDNATGINAYTFDLNLLDDDGDNDASGAAYDIDEVFARTLNITGGGNDDGSNVDTVSFAPGSLSNVLSLIDFSDYEGAVGTMVVDIQDQADVDRNITIRFNDQSANVTENDLGVDDAIVTYEFTQDVADASDIWTITGFDDFATAGLTSLSILDVSGLGITGLADLSIVDDGTDTTITANDPAASGLDFEIFLSGTTGGLNNENFTFA
ncbi:hypothetical protein DSM110093_03820 (plasmid) [Sulfitobacter sp. DSM 110093]|uniref:DUF4214 domain-containing protein n=1 Tax=Sulfitobacter sp. DSM 110093 TaxID=2883127 RepID=UPI001FAD47DB|nr:DUF4214 domain-containing protein [Sulfitobacter sp. DSM 110093]UOA33724.1 hypothetical protein DSM110093_03559 [Sulfitobacter sp. DSM 110093]UOA33985.1 hypothetical protein DSM110093_03820 [Sulfitobacter sp. DSM 110093]